MGNTFLLKKITHPTASDLILKSHEVSMISGHAARGSSPHGRRLACSALSDGADAHTQVSRSRIPHWFVLGSLPQMPISRPLLLHRRLR